MAAAGARDPALANETLAIALTNELPTPLAGRLISEVASQGEHRDLAWNFVKANFAALAAKQGPSFANNFPASLMTNFTDAAHAEELANFGLTRFRQKSRPIFAHTRERERSMPLRPRRGSYANGSARSFVVTPANHLGRRPFATWHRLTSCLSEMRPIGRSPLRHPVRADRARTLNIEH